LYFYVLFRDDVGQYTGKQNTTIISKAFARAR